MKRLLFLAFLTLGTFHSSYGQSDEDKIKEIVLNMFNGMRAGDSAMVHSSFGGDVMFQRVQELPNGEVRIVNSDFNNFLKAVGTPHEEVWDEQIQFGSIQIDGKMASVWTPFKFYRGENFSHCGVNVFKLYKGSDGWKIFHLVDTNRSDNCGWL